MRAASEPARRREGPPTAPSGRAARAGSARAEPRPTRRRRRGAGRARVAASLALVVVVLLAIVARRLWIASRPSTSSAPTTTALVDVYRGLPYELPARDRALQRDYGRACTVDAGPRAARARRSRTTSCARATTPTTSSASSSAGRLEP